MLEDDYGYFFCCVVALSGCLGTGSVPISANASPGQDLMPPSFAGNFFTEICLVTAPSFEGVPNAIAGEPFTQNSKTGTYYHNFADLSIKVHEQGCSLVFKSELDVDKTITKLAHGTRKNAKNWSVEIGRNISVTSRPSPDGRGRYYRMSIPRS